MLALVTALVLGQVAVPLDPLAPLQNGAVDAGPGYLLQVCPGGVCPNPLTGSAGEAFTFSRSSAWTCPNDDGSIQALTSGSICEPKATSGSSSGYGVRIRQAVTNLAQRSASIGTSPWLTDNNTCSLPVASTGSTDVVDPEGGNNASKIVLSACSGGASYEELYQQISESSGSTYLKSLYVRTLTGTCAFNLYTNGGSGCSTTQVTATTSWTRVNVSKTAASASPFYNIGYNGTCSGQQNLTGCTAYVYGAMDELNSTTTPSDLCQTAGSSATCAAETLTGPSYTDSATFCMSAQVNAPAVSAATAQQVMALYNAANSRSYLTSTTGGDIEGGKEVSGTFYDLTSTVPFPTGSLTTVGTYYNGTTLKVCSGGLSGTCQSASKSATAISGSVVAEIGWSGNSGSPNQLNGTATNLVWGNTGTACP